MKENGKERMELNHEPVPGYRGAFYAVLAAGVIYLVVVFLLYAT